MSPYASNKYASKKPPMVIGEPLRAKEILMKQYFVSKKVRPIDITLLGYIVR
jgi:hypothetical protein